MLLLGARSCRRPRLVWGATRTIAALAAAIALLGAFLVNEQRDANPLLPLSVFRIKGLERPTPPS